MNRLPDWRSRLHAYIDKVRSIPYAPGTYDCGLFPAGAVQAMTGEDFAEPYRGKYKTIPEGIRILLKKGFKNHEALAAAHFTEIHPSLAAMGDLVVYETDDDLGYAMGVVINERAFVLKEDALGTLETLAAKRAYRV
jgi:hypothetical protein